MENESISSKKQLAILLSKLSKIEEVNRGLEQYQTDSEIAADILWNAYMLGDIQDSLVYDLGCGNGIFGIGALMIGANKAIFVDKDKIAIDIVKENLLKEAIGDDAAIVLKEDIGTIDFTDDKVSGTKNENIKNKITIMNPPFGTKKEHIDKVFLDKAFSISDTVYSIHKIESKAFLESFSRDNGFSLTNIWKYDFGIKKSHVMHKKKNYNVKVLVARFSRK